MESLDPLINYIKQIFSVLFNHSAFVSLIPLTCLHELQDHSLVYIF